MAFIARSSQASPYDTDCQDYRLTGFKTRAHCLNDCLLKRSTKELGVVPYDVTIFLIKSNHHRLLTEDQSLNETLIGSISSIRSFCQASCPRSDCRSKIFKPFATQSATNTTTDKVSASFFQIPNKPDFEVESMEASTLIQFLCFGASACGRPSLHWTGIHCFAKQTTNGWSSCGESPVIHPASGSS